MMQILLAEDNVADVLLVQQALEEHQIEHQLHVVKDGAAALDFLARMGTTDQLPCPDLLLLDLNLPKVDGAQVLAKFRQHPEGAQTPVIVVTSSDAQRDRELMASLGIARYFLKPSDLEAFMRLGAVVREVVKEAAA